MPRPFCAIVLAMAAPTPNGATHITMPVNLNITSESPSKNSTMVCFGFPFTRPRATPKMIAKITTCSTSLRAAASKMLCGDRCSITESKLTFVAANSFPFSAVPAS